MKKIEFGPEVHDAMPLKVINILFFQQSKFFCAILVRSILVNIHVIQ